jgi:hypothetical protein
MEQFSAATFYDFGSRLGAARMRIELGSEKTIPKETWKASSGHKTLKKVKAQCEAIGLQVSAASVRDFLRGARGDVPSKELLRAISETENTIRREMWVTKFFYMPSEQAKFYSQDELFGVLVNAKFPAIQYDMVEAGNCFAMGRGTACVFHLMRIMEVGVQEFGKKLGVPLVNEKVWHKILEQVDKAIKLLPARAPGTVEMCQTSANLYAVKVAWRNEVMHPNDKYTLEEAKNLIGQVKLFMGQLATII